MHVKRFLRFRIHHLLLLMAIVAVAIVVVRMHFELKHSRQDYDRHVQAWLMLQIEVTEVANASERLYQKEAETSWISDGEARRRHISRLEYLIEKGQADEWQMGPLALKQFNEGKQVIERRIEELSEGIVRPGNQIR